MAFAKNDVSASDAQEIQKLVTSAQQQGSPDCYTGKRRWMRFTAGMRLEITTDPGVPSDSLHVTMQNVSEGGFSFWSKHELKQHKSLFVREFSSVGDREWVPAQVRHCTSGIRGFLIGAEFDNPETDEQQGNALTRR